MSAEFCVVVGVGAGFDAESIITWAKYELGLTRKRRRLAKESGATRQMVIEVSLPGQKATQADMS